MRHLARHSNSKYTKWLLPILVKGGGKTMSRKEKTKKIIAKAERRAKRISSEARSEAKDIVDKAKRKANKKSSDVNDQANENAAKLKRQAKRAIKRAASQSKRKSDDALRSAKERIKDVAGSAVSNGSRVVAEKGDRAMEKLKEAGAEAGDKLSE
jgi:vacuolar-type H+-ATPase subunit E/Vma4